MFEKPKLVLGVLQRKITYIDGFPRWGCFVACILTAIQRSLGRALFAHEIQAWFWKCVQDGCIKHNDLPVKKGSPWFRCYVCNYITAFNVGMKMFGGTRRATAANSSHPANVRIFRWKTPLGYHFTYGSPDKNLHDPDPRLRLLRRAGQRDMYLQNMGEV
ncbi:MAG: hypothetical protein AAF975_02040 [Spirochaetota bacterium]